MVTHPLALQIQRCANFCIIALAVSIPMSVALDNLLLLLLLALVLLGTGREAVRVAVDNPVARANILLFAALSLGLAYGIATLTEAVATLGKYVDLLFVPLLMVAGKSFRMRRIAMLFFLVTMLVTATLSWSVGLGMLPPQKWMWLNLLPNPIENPAIFRSSITQNMLMAYATYLSLLQSRMATNQRVWWLSIIAALIMGGSVFCMVQGKTGYLALLALLIYFAWITWSRCLSFQGHAMGWRETAGLSLIVLLVVFSTYYAVPRMHERVNQALTEFGDWQPNTYTDSSTGARLQFYANTFALIKQHPVLGIGTGGFPAAYAAYVQGKDMVHTRNPHNEYLLITAQIGIGGLALLLYLFFTQWRCAARLPTTFEQDAARGLVLTIAITALFNSPLLDHTEGLFFAYASALLFSNLNTSKREG